MKEKVLKLINSGNWDDILLGIELSYSLDIEEFEDIFKKGTNTSLITKFEGSWFAFGRKNVEYHITEIGHIHVYADNVEILLKEKLNAPSNRGNWYNIKYSET